MKKKRLTKKLLLILLFVIFFIAGAGFLYVKNYYHSDNSVQKFLNGNEQVAVNVIEEGLFIDGAGDSTALIFYPGAKVEYSAYLPMLLSLAEQGVDSFIIKMPCNLAFLGKNEADDIIENYSYEKWYMSGHSLGGAMAASYSAKNIEKLEGLILLAAYPTESLYKEDFKVLSVYGSEDKVLNMDKFEEGMTYMPENYTLLCIEGGNHAYFGNYGEQKGDGKALIDREEQQEQTVNAVLKMLGN